MSGGKRVGSFARRVVIPTKGISCRLAPSARDEWTLGRFPGTIALKTNRGRGRSRRGRGRGWRRSFRPGTRCRRSSRRGQRPERPGRCCPSTPRGRFRTAAGKPSPPRKQGPSPRRKGIRLSVVSPKSWASAYAAFGATLPKHVPSQFALLDPPYIRHLGTQRGGQETRKDAPILRIRSAAPSVIQGR